MITKKRGQIPSHLFVYILAVILFSLILLYGYDSIIGFKEKAEHISYIKFKTDMISTVKRVSPDYGTLKRERLFIGGDFSRVCFVQSYKSEENRIPILLGIGNNEPILKDSFEDRTNKNVFLFKKTLAESFDAGPVGIGSGISGNTEWVSGAYGCIPIINGKVNMQFEGKGDHALISEWG